ncbi:MAG: asparagine synthase (glutamine-hydrolyzing) [Lachnospiraceae bacterium]|nr:asparagine synthase (glutamine-hydrolyzing) [Lachnospiraceae bacterium]
MCGIFGALHVNMTEEKAWYCLNQLYHRGPDGGSIYQKDGLTLGHRRLSILDVSERGTQPMHYGDGRYTLVFNGEIYNFLELRSELEAKGYTFASDTDSEVIIAAFIEWGEACEERFNGMWAFALWDAYEKELFISRDRFGVKPLYYCYLPSGGFAFASEMKALLPLLPEVKADMTAFMTYRTRVHYEDQEQCLIEGIHRFPAGFHAHVDGSGEIVPEAVSIRRYWNTLDHLMEVPASYEEQVELFRELFLDSCKLRMRSDVTIGTALSGGLDSSASICAMSHIASHGGTGRMQDDWQHAFVASFPHTKLDESAYAKMVTDHLGISSTFLEVEDTVSLEKLQEYVYLFEELYTNMQVPMIKIYEQERLHNTLVSIDGHGADELYGGYSFDILKALTDANAVDADRIIKTYMDMNSDQDTVIGSEEFLATKKRLYKDEVFKQKVKKFLGIAPMKSAYSSHPNFKKLDTLNKTLFVSTHETILPTLLRNYDRASMINGVEIRMPFMDYRLVQLAFSLGHEAKVRNFYSKNIIRDACAPYMPKEIAYRRGKIGFNAPILDWMKGPYKEMFLDLTSSSGFKSSPLVQHPEAVRQDLQGVIDGSKGFHEAAMVWNEIQMYLWELEFLHGKKHARV